MKNSSRKYVFLLFVACGLFTSLVAQQKTGRLLIAERGSFMVGGTRTEFAGTFSVEKALTPAGQTFHGDHAYIFYQ